MVRLVLGIGLANVDTPGVIHYDTPAFKTDGGACRMPIIKSSMKDTRRIKSRTARNRAEKSRVRTAVKAVRAAKNHEEAQIKLREATKAIDKAWSHGVIKRNTASRVKSRLSVLVAKLAKKA
jgi:small subunit ribosomal protein S20